MKRNISLTFSMMTALILLCGFTTGKPEGNMFISTDNGNTWLRADQGFPKEELLTAWTNHQDHFIGGTSKHGIYIFDMQQSQWNAANKGLPAEPKIRALTSDNGMVIAALEGDGLYSSGDGGMHWQYMKNSPSDRVRTVFSVNQKIYLGTDVGIYISDGLNKPWAHSAVLLPTNAIVSYRGKIYAATNKGIIRSNGDNNWEVVTSDYGVSQIIITPREMAAITFDGRIILSNADGSAWSPLPTLLENHYTCQIEMTGSKVIIEPWMSTLPFVRQRVYSGAAEKAVLRKLVPVKGGILMVNTDDGC